MDPIRTIAKRNIQQLCDLTRNAKRISGPTAPSVPYNRPDWEPDSFYVVVDKDGNLPSDTSDFDANEAALRPCDCAYVVPLAGFDASKIDVTDYDETICYVRCSAPIRKIYQAFFGGMAFPGDIVRGGQNRFSGRLETTANTRTQICIALSGTDLIVVGVDGDDTGITIDPNNIKSHDPDFEFEEETIYTATWMPKEPTIESHCDKENCGKWLVNPGGTAKPPFICCECEFPELFICPVEGVTFKPNGVPVVSGGVISHPYIICIDATGEELPFAFTNNCSEDGCRFQLIRGNGSFPDFNLAWGTHPDCCEPTCFCCPNGDDGLFLLLSGFPVPWFSNGNLDINGLFPVTTNFPGGSCLIQGAKTIPFVNEFGPAVANLSVSTQVPPSGQNQGDYIVDICLSYTQGGISTIPCCGKYKFDFDFVGACRELPAVGQFLSSPCFAYQPWDIGTVTLNCGPVIIDPV